MHVDVQPHAHNRVPRRALQGRLHQDAGYLLPANPHVVRPLYGRRQPGQLGGGATDGEGGGHVHMVEPAAGGPQHHREGKAASGRREPASIEAPPAAGLLLGHDDGALGATVLCQPPRLVHG